MDCLREGFLCKAKSIVSSLCGIILWASRLSLPMQTPKEFPAHPYYLQLGLKALISAQKETPHNLSHQPFIVHSYMILSPSPPSSSLPSPSSSSSSSSSSSFSLFESMTHSSSFSSWSSMMGDLIGTESGIDTSTDLDTIPGGGFEKIEPYKFSGSKRNQPCKTKKEYPPPIPLLARTGNLPGHMPWVLTRHYVDGRLILKEKRVKHHEYFEAHRENGRLVLYLVPMEDTVRCCHADCEKNENMEIEDLDFIEEENELDENTEDGEETEDDDEDDDGCNDNAENSGIPDFDEPYEDDERLQEMVDEAPVPKNSKAILASSLPWENVSKRNENIRQCFTYAGTRMSDSNFFGMPIPMNRTVRT